jgi:hypothetical protein
VIEAHGKFAEAADPNGARCAATGSVHRDLGRGADESEIAVPRIHFMKARADALLRPDREADCGEQRALWDSGDHRPEEKFAGVDHGLAAYIAHDDLGAERERHQRDFRRRIGMRDRAADRAAPPRRRMPDPGKYFGEERQFGCDQRIVLRRGLPRGGADDDGIAVLSDIRQFRQAEDIDEPCRSRQPHRQQRHQRLTAGNDARVVVLRE